MANKERYNQKKRDHKSGLTKSRKNTQDLLRVAQERIEMGEQYWEDNWDEGKDDLQFLNGKQWGEEVKQERERDGRPCFMANILPTYVYRIIGDQRQNDMSIKVTGVNPKMHKDPESGNLEETKIMNQAGTDSYSRAKIYEGMIRSIQENCDAEDSYDSAFQAAVESSMGFLRIRNDYLDESDPETEQDLIIESIDNQFSVTMDPEARKEDCSDMNWCFIEDTMSRTAFEKKYPGKTPDAALSDNDNETAGWYSEDKVRICEYFTREETIKEIAYMSDGTILDLEEAESIIDDLAEGAIDEHGFQTPPVTILKKRNIKTHKVIWRKITGLDVLDGPIELNCSTIPVVPVFGKCIIIDGKKYYQSAIRWAKDPQRMANFLDSAALESIGNASKAPWLVEVEQIEGLEHHWKNANKVNTPYLPYKATPNGKMPSRQPPPGVPVAELALSGSMTDKVRQTTGIHEASLGQKSTEKSGIAINARDRQAEIGTFTFSDNLSRALRRVGQLLVEMIPYIYDNERVVRLVFDEGKEDFIQLNKQVLDTETNKYVTVNSIGVGKYDVKVHTGASANTQRQEDAEKLDNFVKNYPQAAVASGDILAEKMNMPELARRLKIIMPQHLLPKHEQQEISKDQPEPPPPTPAEQAEMAKAEAEIAKAEAEKAKAQATIKQAEADALQAEADILFLQQGGDSGLQQQARENVAKAIAEAGIQRGPQ